MGYKRPVSVPMDVLVKDIKRKENKPNQIWHRACFNKTTILPSPIHSCIWKSINCQQINQLTRYHPPSPTKQPCLNVISWPAPYYCRNNFGRRTKTERKPDERNNSATNKTNNTVNSKQASHSHTKTGKPHIRFPNTSHLRYDRTTKV
jgi:hypothetical protein